MGVNNSSPGNSSGSVYMYDSENTETWRFPCQYQLLHWSKKTSNPIQKRNLQAPGIDAYRHELFIHLVHAWVMWWIHIEGFGTVVFERAFWCTHKHRFIDHNFRNSCISGSITKGERNKVPRSLSDGKMICKAGLCFRCTFTIFLGSFLRVKFHVLRRSHDISA